MKFLKYFHFLFVVLCVGFAFGMKNNEPTFEQSIEKFVKKAMDIQHVPACAVAVIKDGKITYVQGFGYRDIENKKEANAETLFAIGSCTKSFTAKAIEKLVQQNKLDWDTPIKTYLPDFELYDKEATEKLSLRDCLCHRSGLPRYDILWNMVKSRKELAYSLRYLKPSAKFRETWQYNNWMYVLAAYVLESVSGMSWDAFIQKNILDSLGMKNTYFSSSIVSKHKNAALAYEFDEKNQVFKHIDYNDIFPVHGPAGSIHSSVLDMANWLIMNMQDEKLNSEVYKPQMLKKHDGKDYYCFGWAKTSDGEISHDGGTKGCSALVTFRPKEQFGIVVLANIADVNDSFNEVLATYVYALINNNKTVIQECEESLLKPKIEMIENTEKVSEEKQQFPQIMPTKEQAQQFVGTYHNDFFGDIVINANDTNLICVFFGENFDLKYMNESALLFIDTGWELRFKKGILEKPEKFDVDIESGCPYEFVKI